MTHPALRAAYEADDVVAMVRKVFAGRVRFIDGVGEIAPGITVHRIGGHTDGMQAVRVWTRRGWIVLASDASHFYANMEQGRSFPIVHNVGDMLEGHRTLYRLADGADHVIPGHDPLVMLRYPAASPDFQGLAVCLDADPVAASRGPSGDL
jgi:glyoxylase-like metal-dependent hydrolase (beta-lactamase superfamily II)